MKERSVSKITDKAKKKHSLKEFEKIRIELEAKSRLFTTSLGMISYQKYHDLYELG
ncbi:hypothetical protein P7H00_00960 [Enterococcus pseudoavium]|uniref:Uncharacterized protein n=1 Tax=Enterococcus pseudoavium TaxID=44007 RepID=A0AAE4HXJ1_9ENTE|nr:hypothetical protein [Enterococcus pseudoavium]MDT2735699.1 hypothetical protein [Enterococcus pseudoavium]MDT2755625.1 hypothetical protein [Enterococcus pseudoavium]MDT2769274.1 hypothetical protein [Enterococcus pseudoavium]